MTRLHISAKDIPQGASEIYILHHLSFLVRVFLDLEAVEPLPILNIPGVEALNVVVELVVPKLMDGVVVGAEKLNPVPEFEVVVPNWKGAEAEVLLLLPKANAVAFCCGGFWLAPKVNIPEVLLSFALAFPKLGVEDTLGVPKVEEGCAPNGDTLLLSLNAGGPFAVDAVPMPNVGFDEIEAFGPANVLFGAGELKWLVVVPFAAPNAGAPPAALSRLNIELIPKFCEAEVCAPGFSLF